MGEEIWLLTISSSQSNEGGFSFGILRVEMSRQQDTASDDMLALEFDDPHKS